MSATAVFKHQELRHKLVTMREEFTGWQEDTADKKPLRLHQSQIAALLGSTSVSDSGNRAPLARLWRSLDQRLPKEPPGKNETAAFLEKAGETEYLLLGAHAVWNFFRDKFAQRYLPRCAEYLAIADEIAWACYRPARDAAKTKHSPPLIHLSAEGPQDGPAMHSRGREWLPADTPDAFLDRAALRSAIEPLAVPVMTLTWAQNAHLPDLPVIAHEVGHAVEDDFKLTKELNIAIGSAIAKAKKDGKPHGNHDAWLAWMGEIFADLHGAVHLGPAFAAALTDILSTSSRRSRTEDRSGGSYPTDSLRMRINHAALESLGFSAEAVTLAETWRTAVPDNPASPDYDDGIPYIVSALLDTPLKGIGGITLRSLGGWDMDRRKELARLSALSAAAPVDSRDTRLVCVAMRSCYDGEPAGFFAKPDNALPPPSDKWRLALRNCQPPTGTRAPAPAGDAPDVDLESLLLSLRPQNSSPNPPPP